MPLILPIAYFLNVKKNLSVGE